MVMDANVNLQMIFFSHGCSFTIALSLWYQQQIHQPLECCNHLSFIIMFTKDETNEVQSLVTKCYWSFKGHSLKVPLVVTLKPQN